MKKQPNHFQPTKAKRQALTALADYFCLNAQMAAELLDICLRGVQRHYSRLEAAGLVCSIPYYPEDKEKGAAPRAWGLSDSGVDKAFAEGFATDSTKTFDEHSLRTVEHELMISKFHLELAKLADAKGWDLRWRQRDLKKKMVNPDALFSLNGHFLFLEIERAKLGNYRNGEPQILRKLKSYRNYYGSPDCERDFGFKMFSIVTVMRTSARAANLVALIRKSGLNENIFYTSSERDLFRFTSANASPQTILESFAMHSAIPAFPA
jgi:hypothetical protein